MPRSTGKTLLFVVLVGAFLVLFLGVFGTGSSSASEKTIYSALIARAERNPGSILQVRFRPTSKTVEATLVGGRTVSSHYPSDQSQAAFQSLLQRQHVNFDSSGTGGGSALVSIIWTLLPFVLLFGLSFLFMRQAQGGAGDGVKMTGFGKSRAKRLAPNSGTIGFADVAGAEEAVEELHEVVAFLKQPRTFQALGARIPSGVLLHGPPGTGKTLLARAVAGEAGVPFFSIAGSDFVEMFVGVGASRVRDLFAQAREAAPAIVFVDEIDAVGRHRGAGLGGGNDEREQTLNQLLVEMDGFQPKDRVILIAATNRPDVLDPALLRPGRFDRQIAVGSPDRNGRRQILEVHAQGKPLAPGVDLDALAAGTTGLTGADLANLLNEAALLAARNGKTLIEQDELDEGVMRVIAGPEKKTRLLSEAERAITAYHELGHALVGHFLEHTDPVHKVTIVSRGQALGLTVSLPREDTYLTTRSALKDRLAMTLGGRVAEELVFGEITTGAANDLDKVTQIAKRMVMQFGMSEAIGPRVLGRNHDNPFLGREMGGEADYSTEVARKIDDEIGRLIAQAHEQALTVLRGRMDELHKLAAILLERETIDRGQFERLLAGEPPDEVFREPFVPRAPVDGRPGRSPAERPSPRPRLFPAPGTLAAIPPGRSQRPHGTGGR